MNVPGYGIQRRHPQTDTPTCTCTCTATHLFPTCSHPTVPLLLTGLCQACGLLPTTWRRAEAHTVNSTHHCLLQHMSPPPVKHTWHPSYWKPFSQQHCCVGGGHRGWCPHQSIITDPLPSRQIHKELVQHTSCTSCNRVS